jgi:hypothetical protein
MPALSESLHVPELDKSVCQVVFPNDKSENESGGASRQVLVSRKMGVWDGFALDSAMAYYPGLE